MGDVDKWIEIVKDCKYLPENELKKLCDMVCDILLEETNIQPVSTPVTVCGDIHGQVNGHDGIRSHCFKWQPNCSTMLLLSHIGQANR